MRKRKQWIAALKSLWVVEIRGEFGSPLTLNAVSLVSTQALTSILGFLYWAVAARFFSAAEVGFASVSVSSMLLLGNMSVLGMGTLLIGELPRRQHNRGNMIAAAVLVAGVVGTGLGLLFGWLSPWLASDLEVLSLNPVMYLGFAVGVGLCGAGLIVDQSAIGLLRGDVQLIRNGVQALLKLLLLLVVGIYGLSVLGVSIYWTWTAATALSLLVPIAAYVYSGRNMSAFVPNWGILNGLRRDAFDHHAFNLTQIGPGLLLPVIVTSVLTTRVNAYFHVTWMIAAFLFAVPSALTTTLYAVGVGDPAALPSKLRFSLVLSCGLGVVAMLGVLGLGRVVLSAFGTDYVDNAYSGLVILSLCSIPVAIRSHFVAVTRIRSMLRQTTWVLLCCGIGELVFAWIGAKSGGLTGLFVGWSIAVGLESLAMSRIVLSAARDRAGPMPENDYSGTRIKLNDSIGTEIPKRV